MSAMQTRGAGNARASVGVGGRLDARALARDLVGAIRGEVRFSAGSRALYANDASVYRQLPIGVVIPRGAQDAIAAVEVCRFFGHVGHGCVHTRIDWDFLTPQGVANYRRFMEDAGDLIARYEGSLSGEHGDGQARAELLEKMFVPELVQAFREFKAIWDPDGMMNPGKVVDPYPLDTNLRMDPSYATPSLKTHFQFPEDGGSFVEAAQRCFGVGMCRDREDTMCPSYMATMEEQHSTRGRARLLFELMRADSPLAGGWRNEEVKRALDLCLACKGCKHECPVRVDMATYKASFAPTTGPGGCGPRTPTLQLPSSDLPRQRSPRADLAQVVRMALEEGPGGFNRGAPEEAVLGMGY